MDCMSHVHNCIYDSYILVNNVGLHPVILLNGSSVWKSCRFFSYLIDVNLHVLFLQTAPLVEQYVKRIIIKGPSTVSIELYYNCCELREVNLTCMQ